MITCVTYFRGNINIFLEGTCIKGLKTSISNLGLLTIVNDTYICTTDNQFHGEIDEGAVQYFNTRV